ncbi:hypothetical protein N9917_03575 [Deltaproteobacteria bacterium]|nr:hypothetical protein [Deltaproteobacteria bacterium]
MPAHTAHLTWEPGNGTHYDVLLTTLDKPFMGHGAGTIMAVISHNPAPVALFLSPGGGYLHWTYVMEKTGLGAHDASVVAEMIGPVIGREFAVHDCWTDRKAEIEAQRGKVPAPTV